MVRVYAYEVRYVGAPYGLNESGHVLSWHKTKQAAEKAKRRLEKFAGYYNQIVITKEGRRDER